MESACEERKETRNMLILRSDMLCSQVEISTRQLEKQLEVFGKVGAGQIIITELECAVVVVVVVVLG